MKHQIGSLYWFLHRWSAGVHSSVLLFHSCHSHPKALEVVQWSCLNWTDYREAPQVLVVFLWDLVSICFESLNIAKTQHTQYSQR